MGRNKGQNPGTSTYTITMEVLLFYISVVGVSVKENHGTAEEINTFLPPFSAAINKMNGALSNQFIL